MPERDTEAAQNDDFCLGGFQRRGQLRGFERRIRFVRQNGEERLFLADSEALNNIVCLGSHK